MGVWSGVIAGQEAHVPGSHPPELAAARLRAWLGQRDARGDDDATPVDALAAQLGLVVESFDPALYPGALGFLEPGEDVIFLRVGLPETLRRFTLAHELGHVALHRRSGLAAEICQSTSVSDADLGEDVCADADLGATHDDDETLRPGQAYSARAQREGEANAFAAALLLPGAPTRAAYLALCAAEVDRPALALARQFGVSEEATLRRLATLLTETDLAERPTSPTETLARLPADSLAPPLDSDQLNAARAHTPALIVAGPGSGKTSALLARVAYLVREQGVAPERVLALTFSRKATDELRERLGRLLGEGFAMPRVSTIHAFCGDILRRYGPLVGLRAEYRLMTEIEGYFLLRRVVSQAPLTQFTPLSGPTMYFRDLLGAISRAKDDLVTPEQYRAAAEQMANAATTPDERAAATRALEVASLYAAYQDTLAAQGDADYADLIALTWRLLRESPEAAAELRARYEQVMVDEYQDINYAMSALLRELVGPRGPIWAVGDVDQAIYRFRGASPRQLLRFTHDYTDARTLPLRHNYRSRPAILLAANAFASAWLPGEERVELTQTRAADNAQADAQADAQATVMLATAPDEAAELDGLAQMMRARVAAGTPLRDQAVLLRTRAYVRRVCAGLRARGVAAQLAEPLLDQPLVKTLLAMASLAVDAQGIGLLRAGELPDHAYSDDDARALLRLADERGLPPLEAIHTIEAQVALSTSALTALRRLERIIAGLRAAPSVATGLSRYLFSWTTLGVRLLDRDDPQARADAGHVARLLALCHAYDDQRASDAVLFDADAGQPLQADWAGLLDYISAVRELGLEAGGAAPAVDEDAALVMTAHAAKGLEFRAVYLPQLARNRFPSQARAETIPPPPGLLREADNDERPLLEEANLFYVAMTRARDTLTLSYSERYGKKSFAASPFIESLEQGMGAELARVRWDGDASSTAGESQLTLPAMASGDETPESSALERQEALTVTLSQLEAYQRCPQQYAYQYVYGLRPAPAPLISLRGALRESDTALRQRFAASGRDTAGEPPTLEEAQAIFGAQWEAARAVAQAASDVNGAARDETLAAIYRRHGERSIERLWRALQRGDHPRDAFAAPDASVASDAADMADVIDPAATLDALSAGSPDIASVTLAGATITGGLDHVELPLAPGATGGAGNGAAGRRIAAPGERRVARYVAGSLDASATLRDLFYTRAAEQMRAQGQDVTVAKVSLASGATKPLRLKPLTIKRLESEASAALAGLARASYPPRPEPRMCASCPFALICPA